MTNPNIERDKVEEIRARLVNLRAGKTAGAARFYTYAPADISLLLSLLTVSEKRAEELQADLMRKHLCFECDAELAGPYCPKCNPPPAELADALIAVHRLTAERDSARSSLMRVREDRDGLRTAIAAMLEANGDEDTTAVHAIGDIAIARSALQASGDGGAAK